MVQFGRSGPTGAGRQVYLRLRGQMADGSLPAGAALPSTRALAAELGLSRTTVTAAYEQLAAEGYVITATGRAARVALPLAQREPLRAAARKPARAAGRVDTVPHPQARARERAQVAPTLSAFARRIGAMALPASLPDPPPAIDFLYGAVAARDFPTLAWRRAYQAELLRQQPRLFYAAPEGDPALRQALHGYLRRARGVVCDVDQIIIVHGSQQGIDLCARLLLDARDRFVFEDPGYLMARRCFEATGARCRPVPVDPHGLDTRRLPRDGSARLAYVTPSHQFPLGGVLPITRRQDLLRWAQRQDAWIVEDDYDGEFRYGQRPIDALQSLDDDGRVIYVGTFSKALSPQLRLGYLVLPSALVPVFQRAKRLTDRHAPVLEQRVLAALIEQGSYERHVRRTRRENERRRAALLEAATQWLPRQARLAGLSAGLHLVLWLPMFPPSDEPRVVAAAREAGVGIYPLSPLFARSRPAGKDACAGFILGYASLSESRIRDGVRMLGKVLARLA